MATAITNADGVAFFEVQGVALGSVTLSATAGGVTDQANATVGDNPAVIIEEPTVSYRYKFTFNPGAMTSDDTNITAYIWRNGQPYTATAERYMGLQGSATPGVLYITDVPSTVSVTDTILGQFFNSTHSSGIGSGTVEVI